ncbi:MAG: hypothetical protein GF365_02055 [Candidatus Buchananbacteria bacterium]|nr:hypothetical protein [Candidatus Buchananbacteria bacterium]
MIVIMVYGFPQGVKSENILSFKQKLKQSASQIEEFGLKSEKVSVFLPKEQTGQKIIIIPESGWPETPELIIFVKGLVLKPIKTRQIKQKLAKNLVEASKEFFPGSFIGCFIEWFEPVVEFFEE